MQNLKLLLSSLPSTEEFLNASIMDPEMLKSKILTAVCGP